MMLSFSTENGYSEFFECITNNFNNRYNLVFVNSIEGLKAYINIAEKFLIELAYMLDEGKSWLCDLKGKTL